MSVSWAHLPRSIQLMTCGMPTGDPVHHNTLAEATPYARYSDDAAPRFGSRDSSPAALRSPPRHGHASPPPLFHLPAASPEPDLPQCSQNASQDAACTQTDPAAGQPGGHTDQQPAAPAALSPAAVEAEGSTAAIDSTSSCQVDAPAASSDPAATGTDPALLRGLNPPASGPRTSLAALSRLKARSQQRQHSRLAESDSQDPDDSTQRASHAQPAAKAASSPAVSPAAGADGAGGRRLSEPAGKRAQCPASDGTRTAGYSETGAGQPGASSGGFGSVRRLSTLQSLSKLRAGSRTRRSLAEAGDAAAAPAPTPDPPQQLHTVEERSPATVTTSPKTSPRCVTTLQALLQSLAACLTDEQGNEGS